MVRLLVLIAVVALFTKPLFILVYRCVRRLYDFWESKDGLEDSYQAKINTERIFNHELKHQEKEIKEKQKALNKYRKEK